MFLSLLLQAVECLEEIEQRHDDTQHINTDVANTRFIWTIPSVMYLHFPLILLFDSQTNAKQKLLISASLWILRARKIHLIRNQTARLSKLELVTS